MIQHHWLQIDENNYYDDYPCYFDSFVPCHGHPVQRTIKLFRSYKGVVVMSFLKGLGQVAGEVTGKVIGGSVRVVGEITGSPFVKEIGNSVEKASIIAGTTAGDLASGVYDTTAGLITNNDQQSSHGMKDIGGALSTTAKGVVGAVKYTYANGKEIVQGLSEEDYEKVKEGAKGLIKVAAVGTLAVGVLDIVDGPDGVDQA